MSEHDPYESTRRTLRRSLVGGGRFTWVHEPGSAMAVSLWPYSQVLHAYALSDPVSGPARFPGLARGVRAYRDRKGGYRESLGRGKRYYDDNAWTALALMQHLAFAADPARRDRVVEIDDFVQTGLDPATGGIRWVEGGDTVNACSTGAGAVLHTLLGHPIDAQLQFLSALRNPDGLVQDHLRADGSIEPGIYSYNQGLLVAAAAHAGDLQLAAEAVEAGEAFFTVDRLWEQPVAFNAVYVKALLRAGHTEQVRAYAQRLAQDGRDDNGWYTQSGRYDEGKVLDTASALQILTLMRFPQLVSRAV